jgi:hypothetical protein
MARVTLPSERGAGVLARRHHWTSTSTYWVITTVVVGESVVGGAMDLFRMPPFYTLMIDLGYPSYLATILGTRRSSPRWCCWHHDCRD